MGLFGTIGKVAGYAIPGLGQVNMAKDAGKLIGKGIKGVGGWLGKKSAGAESVNNRLEGRYTDLMGASNPYNSIISGLQDDYKTSKSRSEGMFGDLSSMYSNFAGANGGIDPSRLASMDENVGRLKTMGRLGADDEDSVNRIRGNGVFDEFAKTGGYSDVDKSNIRARATSVIPSMFGSLKSNLSRQNTAQGGFNPGYGSQQSKLARDAAREAQGASRDAEFGIMDRVNEGRKWGSSSLSGAEQQLMSNMLAGNQGANSAEMAIIDAISQGQRFGASGLDNLRTNPGADLQYQQMILQAMGMKDNQINEILSMMAGRNPNQSNFDKYGMPIINGVIGGAKAFAG